MATLNLTHVWINLVSTGEAVHFRSSNRSESFDNEGEVKTYAGGRRRSFSKVGRKRTLNFTLRAVDQDGLDQLNEWAERLVLVRDYKGRKMYGTYYTLGIAEFKSSNLYDVTMSVTEVTQVEEV